MASRVKGPPDRGMWAITSYFNPARYRSRLRNYHLWHGHKQDRRYAERFADFERFAFDPFRDVAMDGAGCWRWNTDKAEMHRYVREYLVGRREDD